MLLEMHLLTKYMGMITLPCLKDVSLRLIFRIAFLNLFDARDFSKLHNTPWKVWDEWEGYLFIAKGKKCGCTGEVGKGNWQDPQPQVYSPGDKKELKTWKHFKQVSDPLKPFMLADKWCFQSSTEFQKQFDLLKHWNPYSINTPFSDMAQRKIKFHASQIISNSELIVLQFVLLCFTLLMKF